MSLDLTKLSPAPWRWGCWNTTFGTGEPEEVSERRTLEHNPSLGSNAGVRREEDQCLFVLHRESGECEEADLEFIALARNAFEVMMRRGWGPRRGTDGEWVLLDDDGDGIYRMKKFGGDGSRFRSMDPFTALVEADRWYRENVEAKP